MTELRPGTRVRWRSANGRRVNSGEFVAHDGEKVIVRYELSLGKLVRGLSISKQKQLTILRTQLIDPS